MPTLRGQAVSGHWGDNPTDTYLETIYVCSSCAWRLTECKCPPDPEGWNMNRYAASIPADLYNLGPTPAPPLAFVRFEGKP